MRGLELYVSFELFQGLAEFGGRFGTPI